MIGGVEEDSNFRERLHFSQITGQPACLATIATIITSFFA
jgi:hypothetical protein